MTLVRRLELFFGVVIPTVLAAPFLIGFIGVVMITHMDTGALMVMGGLDVRSRSNGNCFFMVIDPSWAGSD